MKNFLFIYLAMFSLSALLFTSCGDDPIGIDPDAPIVTVTGDNTATVDAGTMVDFNISAIVGKRDLTTVTVSVDGSDADVNDFTVGGFATTNPITLLDPETENGFNYTMSFRAPAVDGTSFTYTVTVEDKKELTGSVDLIVTASLDNTPPTISLSGNSSVTPDASVSFEVTGAVGGSDLASLTFYRDNVVMDAALVRVDVANTLTPLTENPLTLEGSAVSGFTVKYNLMAPDTEGSTYVYRIVLTDANGQEASADYSITKEISVQTEAFTFVRCGSDGTGLSKYGLAWTSNTSSVAILKKDADKLVNLAGMSMTFDGLTTAAQIAAAIDAGSDIADYREVSVDASSAYDLLIGTKVGDDYYLLNITNGLVEAGQTCGTRITITGNAKF